MILTDLQRQARLKIWLYACLVDLKKYELAHMTRSSTR
jgi:hypothetical protein